MSEKRRKSQADRMIEMALEQDITLFTDQRGNLYIRVPMSDIYHTLRLRSKSVRAWLAGLLWKAERKAPSSEALASALNVLEAHAYEGGKIPLYNRVAPDGLGGIFIDMADREWRAIHVTREGWKIDNNPPILFRRYSHQKALPEPVRGGSVEPLLAFSNLKEEDERLLFLVAVISYFIPDVPHVVLVLHGPQGSGKTWTLRAARAVTDPSILDLLTLPRQQRELVQNLDHHYAAFYDNVGRVPPWISNVLCRAVTGTGVSKRQLYTDDEDIIYEYHRCCGLTDINIAAERGDLLDRSILLGLEVRPKYQQKTEEELRTLLGKKAPEILGGILDILVKAMNIYPDVELKELFRMADFTKWGHAITEAMGIDPRRFIEAYSENIKEQSLEAVRASPVAEVLIKFMELMIRGRWSGTASQLWSQLQAMAEELKISTKQKAWPKNPKILSRRLNELAPSLPAAGYEIERIRKGKKGTRLIIINAVSDVSHVSHSEGADDTDDTDDTDKILVNSSGYKCAYCGIPLNNETGLFMDPWTSKKYCRQHWVARRRMKAEEAGAT